MTQAVRTSERWLELAKKDAEAMSDERDIQEKQALLATMGLTEKDPVPPALRAEVKRLEESQKRRNTRAERDGLDRILVDLLALYRDVLSMQLNANVDLVNKDLREKIELVAKSTSSADSIHKLAAIEVARQRIDRNVRDQMVLDSLAVSLQYSKGH